MFRPLWLFHNITAFRWIIYLDFPTTSCHTQNQVYSKKNRNCYSYSNALTLLKRRNPFHTFKACSVRNKIIRLMFNLQMGYNNMVDIILITLFLLISIALIAIASACKRRIKKNCSIEIEAVVEKHEVHHDYSSNHQHRVSLYGYDYNGTHYIGYAKNRLGESKIGAKQMIMIDPENPQNSYRQEDLLLPKALLFFGVIMLCISAFYEIKIIIDLLNL